MNLSRMRNAIRNLLLLGGLLIGAWSPARACMDVIPQFHQVTCHYDSTFWVNYAVRVGSLRMLANADGTYCTCAFHNNSPFFDLIDYIALVDSGTNHLVDGISPWYEWAPASSGWDSIYQIVWRGFLSQVTFQGTQPGPVELIIRGHFPPGYAFIPMQNDLPPTILGWGTWNNTTMRPNPDRWWLDWPLDSNFVFVNVPHGNSFFNDLDQNLVYTGSASPALADALQVFPVPARDHIDFRVSDRSVLVRSIELWDMQGRLHYRQDALAGTEGRLDLAALAPGSYCMRLQTNKGMVSKRFSKLG